MVVYAEMGKNTHTILRPDVTVLRAKIKKFYSIFFKKSRGPGAEPRSPAAAGEIPAPRTARNSQSSIAPSADGANPGASAPRPLSPPQSGWRTAALFPPPDTNIGCTYAKRYPLSAAWEAPALWCSTRQTVEYSKCLPALGAAYHSCVRQRYRVPLLVDGSRRPPRGGGGESHGHWPWVAPSADGALERLGVSPAAAGGRFAPHAARVFRPLRRTTNGFAFGNRDFLKKIE